MPFVSITRLRIRSLFYMPSFLWHTSKSTRQAQRTPGFIGGRMLVEPKSVFWTMTAWSEAAAMNAFRTQGAHGRVMPKLLDWCDEASVVHWIQENQELPTWQDAYNRLIGEGRPSKVKHPSPAHLAHQIPPPRPGRIQQTLKPQAQ